MNETARAIARATTGLLMVMNMAEGHNGTGFIINPAGLAVTNQHVVGNADYVLTVTVQGQACLAPVLHRDQECDLATIRVDMQPGMQALDLGASDTTPIGEDVIALGYPDNSHGYFWDNYTATRGIISGKPRKGEVTYIQTDADLNPGNSGGPLVDRRGRAIGVNTMGIDQLNGMNFAVSADTLLKWLADGERVIKQDTRRAEPATVERRPTPSGIDAIYAYTNDPHSHKESPTMSTNEGYDHGYGDDDAANLLEDLEFADNPEPRCTCVILVDTSSSMQAGGRIDKVNEALQDFASLIRQDSLTARRVDIAIISFNTTVELVTDFTSGLDFNPPPPLRARGGTKLAAAVLDGLQRCEERKEVYRANNIAYYRSFLMVLTDGRPEHDSPADITAAAAAVQDAEKQRKAAVRCFGIAGADVDAIRAIIPGTHQELLDPSQLPAALEWLSNSMTAISESQPGDSVSLPPTDFLDF